MPGREYRPGKRPSEIDGRAEVHFDGSAAARSVECPHRPTTSRADVLDEREAEAVTRLLAATMEALENPIRVAFREAGAAILHGQSTALQYAAHLHPLAVPQRIRQQIAKNQLQKC